MMTDLLTFLTNADLGLVTLIAGIVSTGAVISIAMSLFKRAR